MNVSPPREAVYLWRIKYQRHLQDRLYYLFLCRIFFAICNQRKVSIVLDINFLTKYFILYNINLPCVGSITTPAVSLTQNPSSSKVNDAASGGPSYRKPYLAEHGILLRIERHLEYLVRHNLGLSYLLA